MKTLSRALNALRAWRVEIADEASIKCDPRASTPPVGRWTDQSCEDLLRESRNRDREYWVVMSTWM